VGHRAQSVSPEVACLPEQAEAGRLRQACDPVLYGRVRLSFRQRAMGLFTTPNAGLVTRHRGTLASARRAMGTPRLLGPK